MVKIYFELIWEIFPLFCDNFFESSATDVCSYGMWSIHYSLNISWKFIWLSVKKGVIARCVEHFYRLFNSHLHLKSF
jgi:hypothetical protein